MIVRPPRPTRTHTLFPYTTLFRSHLVGNGGMKRQPWARIAGIIALAAAILWLMGRTPICRCGDVKLWHGVVASAQNRSEEHTSELQSLMRISYAVFCLKKKRNSNKIRYSHHRRLHKTIRSP